MLGSPSSYRLGLIVSLLLCAHTGMAQRSGGRSPGTPNIPRTPTPGTNNTQGRPIFVSGKVILQGGSAPSEPVAIERICNGAVRREGYTDFKGQFEFELGRTVSDQDASEDDNSRPGTIRNSPANAVSTRFRFSDCEFRAVLAGFQSTVVRLNVDDDFGPLQVGTIVLKRIGNVEGTTISMTSMAAPKDARHAYEKARKFQDDKKLPDAEKELNKAVEIYPRYAAAWSMLGEIHRLLKQDEEAVKDFNEALKADPQFVTPYFGLALLAINQKQWEEAARQTEQLVHLNGFAYPIAYFYNAAANFNLGRLEPAEQSARKLETMDTAHQYPDVLLLLGHILFAKHDFAGAAQQMRDYLVLVPHSPDADKIRVDIQKLESMSVAKKN